MWTGNSVLENIHSFLTVIVNEAFIYLTKYCVFFQNNCKYVASIHFSFHLLLPSYILCGQHILVGYAKLKVTFIRNYKASEIRLLNECIIKQRLAGKAIKYKLTNDFLVIIFTRKNYCDESAQQTTLTLTVTQWSCGSRHLCSMPDP